jgi:hypothetical protein
LALILSFNISQNILKDLKICFGLVVSNFSAIRPQPESIVNGIASSVCLALVFEINYSSPNFSLTVLIFTASKECVRIVLGFRFWFSGRTAYTSCLHRFLPILINKLHLAEVRFNTAFRGLRFLIALQLCEYFCGSFT